jgi:hypothetical protein
MSRSLGVAACAATLLPLLVCSCVDGTAPQGADAGISASVLVAPRFAPQAEVAASTVVSRIRLTALNSATGTVLGTQDTEVDPDASEWQIAMEVDLGGEASLTVVVEIELLDGAVVQWSGRTGTMTLSASSAGATHLVEVYRGPLDNLAVEAVVITDPPASLVEGAQATLAAELTLAQGATGSPEVFWTSLDPSVASVVEATGEITALLPGLARVRAVAGPASDEVQIRVLPRPDAVELSPASATLESLTQDVTFQARVLDVRGEEVPGMEVLWSSDDEAVLSSGGDGLFVSVSNGVASAVAALAGDPEISGRAQVTVEQVIVQAAAEPTALSLVSLGQTASVVGSALDALGMPVDDARLSWHSSDEDVVTVDDDGVVLAVGEGEATLTLTATRAATAGTATAEVAVAVDFTVAEVRVTPSEVALTGLGSSVQLTAEALDALGGVVEGRTFEWSSADPAVATVSQTGLATATGPGITWISASTDEVTGVAWLEVLAPDLTIEDFEVLPDGEPGTVISTPEVLFRVTVRNQGTGPAGATDLLIRLLAPGTDLDLDAPEVLPQPPLAAGETTVVEWRSSASDVSPDIELPRFVDFGAVTDGSNAVAESDESNNAARSGPFDASRLSLPVGYTVGWIGGTPSAESDWHTAANWTGGEGPVPTDNVYVPADAAHQPVLSDDATVADLLVEHGATLDLGDMRLTVTGSLDAGTTILGDGTLIMTGEGVTLSGTVPDVDLEGDVWLADDTRFTGYARVRSGGRLTLAGRTLTADRGLTVEVGSPGTGLVMADAGDELVVEGAFVLQTTGPEDATGLFSAGTIRARSTFSQRWTAEAHTPTSFASTGTAVVFDGSAVQGVYFDAPGAAASRFHDAEVASGADVRFFTDVHVTSGLTTVGTLRIVEGTTTTVGGGFVLEAGATVYVDGTLEAGWCIDRGGTILGQGTHPCGPAAKTWIGGDENGPTDWSVAANWIPAGVPTSSDDVVIPPSEFPPTLAADAYVRDLEVQSQARLDLVGFALYASGSVDAGQTITGRGTLYLTGDGTTQSGSVPALTIFGGDVSLAGLTRVNGRATLETLSRLTLNGHTLEVLGDLLVKVGQPASGLVMTDPTDDLTVRGMIWYDSDGPQSAEGLLTAGTIHALGPLIQRYNDDAHSEAVFVSTGTHVVYEGREPQNTSLATPGPNGSRFHTLQVAPGAMVTFTSFAHIVSTFTIEGSVLIDPANVIDVGGTLTLGAGSLLYNDGTVNAAACVDLGAEIGGSGSLNCQPGSHQ